MHNSLTRWGDCSSRSHCIEHLGILGEMLDLRLPYMKRTSERIENASRILGNMLRLNTVQMFSLSLVAFYRDVGLIAVADSILMKEGALTSDEMARVNRHTDIGGRFMSKVFPDFPDVEEGVWFHHERPDGKGPHRLKEKEIPVIAAIVSFASAIEAMANDRPHRKRMSLAEIRAEVTCQTGAQFTRAVVSAFEHKAEAVYHKVYDPSETLTLSPSASEK